jgi:hypothetical protein
MQIPMMLMQCLVQLCGMLPYMHLPLVQDKLDACSLELKHAREDCKAHQE